jgi:glutamate racemase
MDMRSDGRPIGIFDSGIGGFSVLREVHAMLPTESILYVADHRYAPYGDRTLEEVADRAIQISGQLIEAGVKLVAVACNSASAAALHRLRATYPATPFVGMEPAVKPAALHSTTGVIGVLATAATFQGALFASVVDRHANGVSIVPIVGSGLAAAVEAGNATSPEVKELLRRYLTPALDAGMDTLVLGCTHYSFLGDAIATIAGDSVTVVDPAPAVARQVGRLLEIHGLAAGLDGPGGLRLATTGSPDQLQTHAVDRLHLDEPEIHRW